MRNVLLMIIVGMMPIHASALDVSQPVKDDDGKPICMIPIAEGECPIDKQATLSRLARFALYNPTQDEEKSLSGEEKYRRGQLGQSLAGATEVKLKVEDLALIKKLIGQRFGPAIVRPVWDMLEK